MDTSTTIKETKDTQDYTNVGYGFINTYTKTYTTTDGVKTWNTGNIKTYTFTFNNEESKRYNYRGNAVRAMFKQLTKGKRK